MEPGELQLILEWTTYIDVMMNNKHVFKNMYVKNKTLDMYRLVKGSQYFIKRFNTIF